MSLKFLLLSTMIHILLISGFIFNFANKPIKKISLEASLVIKNKKIVKQKDLLPKKNIEQASSVISKNTRELKIKPVLEQKNFLNDLEVLSKSFAEDIKKQETKNIQEQEIEYNYFDEIYAQIKNAFIIPPQLDTPAAFRLKTIVKLYLDESGKMLNVELYKTSSDNYFDEIVLAGVKKVQQFSPPPLHLQESLKKAGVVIELCPKNCLN